MPESTLYINGAWVASSDGAVREIRSPHDNSVVATVSEATAADTRDAIKAARDSFDSGVYASWSMKDRCALVEKVADLIKRDAEILASLETRDTGKRMIETRYDMADIEATFRHFAALGLKLKVHLAPRKFAFYNHTGECRDGQNDQALRRGAFRADPLSPC